MKRIIILLVLVCVAALAEDAGKPKSFVQKMLEAMYRDDTGMRKAGLHKLTDDEKSALLAPYTSLLSQGEAGRAALTYLMNSGWRQYSYSIVERDFTKYLIVKDTIGSSWVTKAPLLFHGIGGTLLGKDAIISGPSEIITGDGSHQDMMLSRWERLR